MNGNPDLDIGIVVDCQHTDYPNCSSNAEEKVLKLRSELDLAETNLKSALESIKEANNNVVANTSALGEARKSLLGLQNDLTVSLRP